MSAAPPHIPCPSLRRLARPDAGWSLSLYPQAGEGGGSFTASGRRHYSGIRGAASDPERARVEAGRRARSKLRRYCASNRLNRLGTLTYRGQGCHDPGELRLHVASFFKALRASLGGRPLPYVWVPEWHKTDHGMHVHFAVGRYIRRSLIEAAWGRGFVSIKQLGDLPAGATSWHETRAAAGYLAKYVSKTFDEDWGGLHRDEVAQGFQPQRLRLAGVSARELLAQAVDIMGSQPERSWSSADQDGWQGPPAVWFA
ncbi:hypothetical protein [Geodermatophilus sp. DSM 44513]|uniref:rolling circle replication-associated protein n=1 Tax=Geodermatophilus sp. DSM 44513 TaxID=1528104 RepID=UPI001282DF09|nr:hypothetical protein [Geodermatophilus sp. DSM 44513]WNV75918.1 hypothetical protein RTG05_01260 [Geodermatophilus sp. DSM 44513]